MSNEQDNIAVKGCSELIVGFGLGLLACLLITLCSCKSGHEVIKEQVPVVVTQEHHTESVKIDHVRDTLIQRDSVYHYIQGDTVHIERWHYVQGTTNVVRVDTVHKTDSVQVPVVTTQTIEKRVEVPRPL